MIYINAFDVSKIPDLLIYFIPGYIAVSMYRLISSTKSNGQNTLWVSCVISYIAIAISGIILPEKMLDNFAWKVIFSCIFAIIGATIVSLLAQSKRVESFLLKTLHFSATPNVLSGAITLRERGSVAVVHIDGLPYYIKGAISGYSNSPDDPHMSLKHYAFYDPETDTPTYICEDPMRCFVFDINKVKYMEIWPTTLADMGINEQSNERRSIFRRKVDNTLWDTLQREIRSRNRKNKYVSLHTESVGVAPTIKKSTYIKK